MLPTKTGIMSGIVYITDKKTASKEVDELPNKIAALVVQSYLNWQTFYVL